MLAWPLAALFLGRWYGRPLPVLARQPTVDTECTYLAVPIHRGPNSDEFGILESERDGVLANAKASIRSGSIQLDRHPVRIAESAYKCFVFLHGVNGEIREGRAKRRAACDHGWRRWNRRGIQRRTGMRVRLKIVVHGDQEPQPALWPSDRCASCSACWF